ncbi:helix-turn-helix domain-containing protein [Cohnella fermenti]|uniref:Helix-turn-helix domain-containing protein n=1 Tax=Cohnella fermenti TaxID=2565925 RepID=A0A4S4BF65_9BACL|nr:helix-turn-helix domain-containing protein [Cohnella fermenti]THF72910.1 helix-turn-helix domain-containing protein [Cohnella fermenti]
MPQRTFALIERLDLTDHFFLNYRIREAEYHFFHAHQGIEWLFVHGGSGQAIAGDQLVQVESGSLLMFQPYQLHRIHMSPDTEYVRSVFVFDPVVLDARLDGFPALRRFLRFLWQSELPLQHLELGPLAAEAAPLLRSGAEAVRTADSLERRQEEWALLSIGLLQLIRRAYSADGERLSELDARPRPLRYAEKAMQWIERHYQEEFQLNRMAEELFVSPSHLSRLFHQETGTTLSEYLTARRLREASLLLAATNLPVRDIGRRIGLTNFPYFGKLFKKHFGVTPAKYRKDKRSYTH